MQPRWVEGMKIKKGVLIGKYYKSFDMAVKAYEQMSDFMKKRKSLIQIGDTFLIVGKSQIEAIKL